jgi:hypothetical protein
MFTYDTEGSVVSVERFSIDWFSFRLFKPLLNNFHSCGKLLSYNIFCIFLKNSEFIFLFYVLLVFCSPCVHF